MFVIVCIHIVDWKCEWKTAKASYWYAWSLTHRNGYMKIEIQISRRSGKIKAYFECLLFSHQTILFLSIYLDVGYSKLISLSMLCPLFGAHSELFFIILLNIIIFVFTPKHDCVSSFDFLSLFCVWNISFFFRLKWVAQLFELDRLFLDIEQRKLMEQQCKCENQKAPKKHV